MLDRFINTYVFIIAFGVAVLVVYLLHPEPTIVHRHPNPHNAGKLTYKHDKKNENDDDTCYKYEANEVKCPSDPSLILEHPLIIS
jgi:hypothetical protein